MDMRRQARLRQQQAQQHQDQSQPRPAVAARRAQNRNVRTMPSALAVSAIENAATIHGTGRVDIHTHPYTTPAAQRQLALLGCNEDH